MDIKYATETPCPILKALSDEEKNEVADLVVDYYQKKGFPYYSLSVDERISIFRKLVAYDTSKLELENNELQQNMLGLNLANFYHPQMWEVRCGKSRTPMEVFNDRNLFKRAILKRISMSTTKLQPFNIRKSLRVFGGYSVSNFKPTVAKYIYDRYSGGGVVLDPCMGYGGRLLGALSSSKVTDYMGIDPDNRQIIGNRQMFGNLYGETFNHNYYERHRAFEDIDFKLYDRSFDLVFTSPPYFNAEKYSNEPTQSYIRYPSLDKWLDYFLHKIIDVSYYVLKPGGYFILNIPEKIRNCINEYTDSLYSFVGVKWMRLSKVVGSRKGDGRKFKLEGIYIWQK